MPPTMPHGSDELWSRMYGRRSTRSAGPTARGPERMASSCSVFPSEPLPDERVDDPGDLFAGDRPDTELPALAGDFLGQPGADADVGQEVADDGRPPTAFAPPQRTSMCPPARSSGGRRAWGRAHAAHRDLRAAHVPYGQPARHQGAGAAGRFPVELLPTRGPRALRRYEELAVGRGFTPRATVARPSAR